MGGDRRHLVGHTCFPETHCESEPIGVVAAKAKQGRLCAKAGDVHRNIGCAPGLLGAMRGPHDRDGRFGRDSFHVAPDVAVEHDVANNQHSGIAPVTLDELDDAVEILNHREVTTPFRRPDWAGRRGNSG